MKRSASVVLALALLACGGDDEKIPPRIDAAPIDGPSPVDAPMIDATPTDGPSVDGPNQDGSSPDADVPPDASQADA